MELVSILYENSPPPGYQINTNKANTRTTTMGKPSLRGRHSGTFSESHTREKKETEELTAFLFPIEKAAKKEDSGAAHGRN